MTKDAKENPTPMDKGLAWAPALQHPLDRLYLKKIGDIPLLPKIMGWVVDRQREEIEAMLAGDGFAITKDSLSDAYAVFEAACSALDLDAGRFRFFCEADSSINAFTTGSDIPTVVATRVLLEVCSDEELAFVIGHELGHYICGHVRCHALARYLSEGMKWTPAWLLGVGVEPLVMAWSRYSELSADRAGLLACRDFDAASRVYLKLAGFPSRKGGPANPQRILMDQSIQYAQQLGGRNLLSRLLHQTGHAFSATHPRAIERFAALDEWNDRGFYDELADATPEERIRIAENVGTDYLKNALDMAVVESVADYAEKNLGKSRKESLRLLRKAFLHGDSLQGTALEEIVYAELAVEEKKDGACEYTLSLFLLRGQENPVKATISVDYTSDRDFAPEAIRRQFIQLRQKQVKILVYKPKK
jgi:hypothetical protein